MVGAKSIPSARWPRATAAAERCPGPQQTSYSDRQSKLSPRAVRMCGIAWPVTAAKAAS